MKKTRRTTRVGENVRDALVQVLRHDLKGIDLGMISITEVEVSPDLHYARVFMTGLEEKEARETVERLREQAGQARYALGRRIHLRYTPELDFRYDETAMRALRIESLLAEVMPKNRSDEEVAADEARMAAERGETAEKEEE